MAGILTAKGFRFMFRDDHGRIDRRTWWLAVIALIAAWFAMLLIQGVVSRSGDITKLAPTALFVVATMWLTVCYYFVSAKRFNDRARPAALALIVPATLFADSALHWLGPGLAGLVPGWLSHVVDAATWGAALWNIAELGLMPGNVETPR